MRLVCPNCASQYEVDASLFPEEGREVQCSNCEEVWIQYPVAEEPPLRLDPGAAVTPTRPSERLDSEERDALARAVDEELAAQRETSREDVADADDDAGYRENAESEDEILASLRAQIAAEGGGEFDKKGPAKSGRRDLRKAAEAVGVQVADTEDEAEQKRKWDLEALERERARNSAASGRRDPLARAIQAHESESAPRRRGGLKAGFVTALVLVVAAAGVYLFQAEIAEAYPPAAPYLAQYDALVDQARTQVEALYAEYSVVVMDQIAQFTGDGGE